MKYFDDYWQKNIKKWESSFNKGNYEDNISYLENIGGLFRSNARPSERHQKQRRYLWNGFDLRAGKFTQKSHKTSYINF